jgi:predicted RNA binding protein YcfA (HicA-like mRNA interferase family)
VKAISGKELCRLLEKYGWIQKRIHGSHHIYGRPNHPAIITVPVHGNQSLKTGLLKHLLKLAGLSEDNV